MKKVFISDETDMVLGSMKNIDKIHTLYNSFYEAEVEDDFHVHVYEKAKVFGNAKVYGNAKVFGNAKVYSYAEVFGNAKVYDYAKVYGHAEVYDYATVYSYAEVYGHAIVAGNAKSTKKVINLIGLPYNVTVTDNHIQIGCKQFTFEFAKKLAERNIEIDDEDYNKMIKYKILLLELIKIESEEIK